MYTKFYGFLGRGIQFHGYFLPTPLQKLDRYRYKILRKIENFRHLYQNCMFYGSINLIPGYFLSTPF